VLERLSPVGGPIIAFAGAGSLHQALAKILADKDVRATLVAVRLSTAESGTNSHGYAAIHYDQDGVCKRTSYVPPEAVSLLQPGAETRFDPDQRCALFAREVAFNRRFFDRLSRRIAEDRAFPAPPPEDSPEYDAEEVEQARRQRLDVTQSSRFLNIGIDNQVTWPKQETLASFDRYQMVLMPKTKDNVQSISFDLHKNQLTAEQAMTVINRFLSLLTWCDDQFAIAQDGWSGNPVPVAVPKRNLAFTTTHHWVFNRSIPDSEEVRRALALYREARNAELNFLVSYAVLNYYKIIEIRYHGSKTSTQWVADNLSPVLNDPDDPHDGATFLAACGSESPEMYIYAACRVAVAHASPNRSSDPDALHELRRLHNAASIMRRLARHFIMTELKVSDSLSKD